EMETTHSILRSMAPARLRPQRDIALPGSCRAPALPPKLSHCQVAPSVAAGCHLLPASLHLFLIGRRSRYRARVRVLPIDLCRFEIVSSEILSFARPIFCSQPEQQTAYCLRYLDAD